MADKSYTVIARRYRPKQFDEMVGQEHITRTLGNAIETGRIAHAFLFVGPRGTGKTTTARLLAKALNCPEGPALHPDNESDICRDIMAGNCLDVMEIDGASNNGVEQVRTLRDECVYAPLRCRFKIYIIDEVHMLSQSAFNALLKTLEEPPKHVKFIFATTEAQKILPTIVSRCQRFEFRPIPETSIVEHLTRIAAAEGITAAPGALRAVARLAQGGMRDAQSILDQLISFCGNTIAESDVLDVYGLAAPGQLEALAKALAEADTRQTLEAVDQLANEGRDLWRVLQDLQALIREALLLAVRQGGKSNRLGGPTLTTERLLRMLEALQAGETSVQRGLSDRVNFEVALLQAAEASRARAIDSLLRDLSAFAHELPETAKK